jgi:NAD(P)-dependent dehydrogenase (short-subunit alcohol dehydrogenase family)
VEIKDKVAVVTGAASGIGEAVCDELARRGAKCIAMVDVSDGVTDAAHALNLRYDAPAAQAFQGDVTRPEFRAQVYDAICEQHRAVNICVPAAGIVRDSLAVKIDKNTGKAAMYPVEVFRQVTEVNFVAPIYWSMEMVARMAEDRHKRGLGRWGPKEAIEGAIIFIGSVA